MRQFGTATTYLDLLDQLEQVATSDHMDSVTVAAGGTGYVVGEILTDASVDGTQTHRASFRVLTESAGVVLTAKILDGGAYTSNPASPVITTASASGTGCTLNVTFDGTGWTNRLDETPSGERQIILEGEGGGSDAILVGIKTYQETPEFVIAHNWSLHGFTGFTMGIDFEDQAGISPGLDGDGIPQSSGGAFVPLQNNVGGTFPIDFWFFMTPFRIVFVAKVKDGTTTIYVSGHLGFLNRFGTTTEVPYPIYIAGTTARHDTVFNDTENGRISGIMEMIGINLKTGPGWYRKANSVWQQVKNSILVDTGTLSRSDTDDYTVYPTGQGDHLIHTDVADEIVQNGGGVSWDDFVPPTGVPGSANYQLEPTPNTGGDIFMMVPATVLASALPDIELVGEIDGLFWFSAATGQSSEDLLDDGTDEFVVFQNGNRTEPWSFMAIKDA